jgi:hypothetical protein
MPLRQQVGKFGIHLQIEHIERKEKRYQPHNDEHQSPSLNYKISKLFHELPLIK